MRILLALVFCVGTFGHAEVVKPKNTTEPAIGIAMIDGVKFNYGVQDRGWSAFTQPSDDKLIAKKSFVLDYESTPSETAISSLKFDLDADVTQKCASLGQAEITEQIKSLPLNISPVLKTDIIARNIFGNAVDGVYAVFVCSIAIYSSE